MGKLLRLEFKMILPSKPTYNLVLGELNYFEDKVKIDSWQCTSGCPSYQFSGSTKIKGKGPIPSCQYAQISSYQVSTERIYMPNIKGVQGSFYPIKPSLVSLRGLAYQRGDFGVHFDANVPGSAGCIVFRKQSEWDAFRILMAGTRNSKILAVPLFVSYS